MSENTILWGFISQREMRQSTWFKVSHALNQCLYILQKFWALRKISKKSCSCAEGVIMIYLNQILFKYYENLGICYILYYLDIHQKELNSIQPLFLNPGARLLFVGRSEMWLYHLTSILSHWDIGDYIIWLAFLLMQILVDDFQKVSNFFQYFVFFSMRNDLYDIVYIYL